jgi:hypothetical protein
MNLTGLVTIMVSPDYEVLGIHEYKSRSTIEEIENEICKKSFISINF